MGRSNWKDCFIGNTLESLVLIGRDIEMLVDFRLKDAPLSYGLRLEILYVDACLCELLLCPWDTGVIGNAKIEDWPVFYYELSSDLLMIIY